MNISASIIWSGKSGVVVLVRTARCDYRVIFREGEAFITAPGLETVVELDEGVYPQDDEELCAIILVAQIEGEVEV